MLFSKRSSLRIGTLSSFSDLLFLFKVRGSEVELKKERYVWIVVLQGEVIGSQRGVH